MPLWFNFCLMGTWSSELIAAVFVGDEFFPPLIIETTSWFCSRLTLVVVTEAVVLVVLPFLLRCSFSACYLSGFSVYFVDYCRWVAIIPLSYNTWWVCLCQHYFNFVFYFICLFLCGLIYYPYRGPLFLKNWPHLNPLTLPPAEFSCRLHPYLPGNGWVSGKRRDINVDRYVGSVWSYYCS